MFLFQLVQQNLCSVRNTQANTIAIEEIPRFFRLVDVVVAVVDHMRISN